MAYLCLLYPYAREVLQHFPGGIKSNNCRRSNIQD